MTTSFQHISQLFCAISGEICLDPVITPSGYICERRLLLSKLADTAGRDPFVTDGRSLSESDLISIKLPLATAPPPRPSTASSFSNLLEMMQQEHDTLLLELFDTRKALEETRMELSQALYQNDAAVRVIARLALERDEARRQLMDWSAEAGAPFLQNSTVNLTNAPAVVPEEEHQMDVEEQERKQITTIPEDDLQSLMHAWKQLSEQRKLQHKKKKTDVSLEKPIQISSNSEVQIKSVHKSNKPGVVALTTIFQPKTQHEYVMSVGVDKTLVVYNQSTEQIIQALHNGNNKQFTALDTVYASSSILVGAADASGFIQVFKEVWNEQDNCSVGFELLGTGLQIVPQGEENINVVNLSFHPMGEYILVVLANGNITIVKVADDDLKAISSIQQQQDRSDSSILVTASQLHPDGLIFCVAKSDGSIQVWDLKTQSLASTIEGNNTAVTSIAFSENGYHFAASFESGEVKVWDLRKIKLIATLNTATAEHERDVDDHNQSWVMKGPVRSVAFDPLGRYLAYSSDGGGVRITTVKEWGETYMFSTDFNTAKKNKNVDIKTIIAWSPRSTYIVAGCSKDRSIKLFYSTTTPHNEES